MLKLKFIAFAVVLGGLGLAPRASAQSSWLQDFAGDKTGASFVSWQGPTATVPVENGALHLLTGKEKERNGILFAPIVRRSAWVETSFEMRTRGGDGAGLIFVDALQVATGDAYRMFGDWDEPNLARAFGIGFDTLNPPETNLSTKTAISTTNPNAKFRCTGTPLSASIAAAKPNFAPKAPPIVLYRFGCAWTM